jgi:hypothetical protein
MDAIPGELWEMMLSTNDCYPGCACPDDWFQRTPHRVGAWIAAEGTDAAHRALALLDGLLAEPRFDAEGLSRQTNLHFRDEDEARTWLSAWRPLLADDPP